jgi:hypothetical protein
MGLHRLPSRMALGLIVLGACLGAAPAPAKTDEERKPADLAGAWQLNEDLSQDPRAGRPREGGGRGRRGGGRPPGGGPGGEGPGGGARRQGGFGGQRPPMPPDQIIAMAGGAKNLLIAFEGTELRLTYGEDHRRVLYTDGRKISQEVDEGKALVRQTRWREGHLEIVTRSDRAKITEIWTLTNDGKRIFATVDIDLSGPMPSLSFRRVWDRVTSNDELRHDEGEERVSQLAAGPGTA